MQFTTERTTLDLNLENSSAQEGIFQAKRARVVTSLLFLSDGLAFGTWAGLIPTFQEKYHLLPRQLSWMLLAMIAGAMISMPFTGRMIERSGSNKIASLSAVGFAAMLIPLVLAPQYIYLIGIAFLFGLGKGALDVSVNSQAITVEDALGQPIMSGFQGFWSLGGLSAAFLLSLLMKLGFSPMAFTGVMAIVVLSTAFWSLGRLLPDPTPKETFESGSKTRKPDRLWLLGGLTFLALFSEGVMFDWSAVYAHTVGGASIAFAPIGFASFALCMAISRFLGDFLTAKIGSLLMLRLSGLIMAGGIAIAAITQSFVTILLGFSLVGFGTGNTVPILFGAAGRLKGHGRGSSLAAVTTLGYFGFLSGPPLVGLIAGFSGLPTAFVLVIVAGLVIATLGVGIVRTSDNSDMPCGHRPLTRAFSPPSHL